MHVGPKEREAALRARAAWEQVQADAGNAHQRLQIQCLQIDDPQIWQSNEAVRTRAALHTATNGVRNRVREAAEMVEWLDIVLRPGR